MRRGLAKLAPPPTSASTAAAFSTFSGSGGFGRGRGRGPPPPVSGEDSSVASDDDPLFSDYGRGRGRGRGDGPHPSSPLLPSFSLFASSSQGRGRGSGSGSGITSPDSDAPPKKPFFFSRERDDRDPVPPTKPTSDIDSDNPLPRKPDMSSFVSALGRGKPTTPTEPGSKEQSDRKQQQQMSMSSREDATRRAMEVLSRAGAGSGMRGRGGSGRGMRGRGRGRGRGRESFVEHDDMDYEDGEVGDDEVELDEYFEQAASVALPSPVEDAYQEAVHTNNMIEFEPEYLVGFGNPDIEEKPPMSLEEALETAKPFLIAYAGMSSQEEWEEAVKDVMKRLPKMKEMMDMYCGPDRVTAKQQQEELQRVANTLPRNAPTSVNKFTDRVLLSLQSNPGWGFDKKCQFMDKLAWEVKQHYK
ncbi:hypothetical protein FCM35_KLT06411 [Carex littledalei]|uniref:Uncharacterized protein n=1 Tax=Carex littledalei TaxID=544730 RepID=A0A833QJH1_9POAL|nr:hypothetical protein FCM35_KLT06411 [Carex littledalei]